MDCFVAIPYLRDDGKLHSDLQEIFQSVEYADERPGKTVLEEKARNFGAMVVGTGETVDSDVLESAEQLELVGTLSRGTDHIDLDCCEQEDVSVVSSGTSNSRSVAEHSLALLMVLWKRILDFYDMEDSRTRLEDRPREAAGRKLAVIGVGSVGKEMIDVSKVLGMEVRAWTFNPSRHEEVEVRFVQSLSELVEWSDAVSLHLPLTDKSREIIDRNLLRDIEGEKERVLVNTARAELVEKGLLHNLGDIEVFNAAALDVSRESEEYGRRVITTPHVAGLTQEATRRMRDALVQNIRSELS